MNKLIILLLLLISLKIHAQVGISSTSVMPNASAMLDISATNKGVLITRVSLSSTADVTTIPSPAISLLVYNTNAAMAGGGVGFYYWNGAIWTKLNDGQTQSQNGLWNAAGNNISNANTGHVGIGTTLPTSPLHISGTNSTQLPFSIFTGNNHISAQIQDVMQVGNSDQKIGLYSAVKNHATRNVSIMADVIDNDNHSNYGILGNVSQNPGPMGESFGIVAYDQVGATNTYALSIYGKTIFAGVNNSNVTGATLINAGNGLMEWSKPVAFLANGLANNIEIEAMLNANIIFLNVDYSLSNAYNNSTGKFTAPVAGVYHFDYSIEFQGTTIATAGYITIGLVKNNVYEPSTERRIIAAYSNDQVVGSRDIQLNAGDSIQVKVINYSTSLIRLYNGISSFSGHLVR
jgi:hypothetical protein